MNFLSDTGLESLWEDPEHLYSEKYAMACKMHWDSLAKPLDGLGAFEDIISRIGGIQHSDTPSIRRRCLLIFLSDNGIVEEGVSQCGSEVTHSVAEAMSHGRSTSCIMAEKAGIPVCPVDIGMKGEKIDHIIDQRIRDGSRNFAVEPAMTLKETREAIRAGREVTDSLTKDGLECLLLGEMGIGNTSTAAAVGCALLNLDPGSFIGTGAGLTPEKTANKRKVIRDSLMKYGFFDPEAFDTKTFNPEAFNSVASLSGKTALPEEDILKILAAFGGYDIAGMVGAILSAAAHRIPVVLDGLITLTAALLAVRLVPAVKRILIPSHFPREPLGKRILQELELTSVIHGNMALGEGTGAILLIPMLDVCLDYYYNGTSFSGLGIEAYKRSDKG